MPVTGSGTVAVGTVTIGGTGAITRALDTVNPIAVNGDFTVRLPSNFLNAPTIQYELSTTGLIKVADVFPSTAAYFPNSPLTVSLTMPNVAPGTYKLFAKWVSGSNTYGVASITLEVNAMYVKLARLTGPRGNQFMNLAYATTEPGSFYVYPSSWPSGTCSRKTRAELGQVHTATMYSVPNIFFPSVGSIDESAGSGRYAESDTVCAQFVRSSDSVAEAPYTFNLRWLQRTSGDTLLGLEADASAIAKASLSLVSIATGNWADRSQVFTDGDVHQQTTTNSARIGLEQASGIWQYRITGTLPTDDANYVGQVEGRPPMVFTLN